MVKLNSTALEHQAELRGTAGGRAAGAPLHPYVSRGLNRHSIGLHWLGGDEIKVRGKVPDATIEQTASWVQRQVSGSLAAVRMALGEEEFDRWLETILYLGEMKMSHRHIGAVNHYRAREG